MKRVRENYIQIVPINDRYWCPFRDCSRSRERRGCCNVDGVEFTGWKVGTQARWHTWNERKKGNGHSVPCGLSESGNGRCGKRTYKDVNVNECNGYHLGPDQHLQSNIPELQSPIASPLQNGVDMATEGVKHAAQNSSPHSCTETEACFLMQSHKCGLLPTETLLAAATGLITDDSPLYDDQLISKTLHCVSLRCHPDRTKLAVPWYQSFIARIDALTKPGDGQDGYFAYEQALQEEKATASEYVQHLRQCGFI